MLWARSVRINWVVYWGPVLLSGWSIISTICPEAARYTADVTDCTGTTQRPKLLSKSNRSQFPWSIERIISAIVSEYLIDLWSLPISWAVVLKNHWSPECKRVRLARFSDHMVVVVIWGRRIRSKCDAFIFVIKNNNFVLTRYRRRVSQTNQIQQKENSKSHRSHEIAELKALIKKRRRRLTDWNSFDGTTTVGLPQNIKWPKFPLLATRHPKRQNLMFLSLLHWKSRKEVSTQLTNQRTLSELWPYMADPIVVQEQCTSFYDLALWCIFYLDRSEEQTRDECAIGRRLRRIYRLNRLLSIAQVSLGEVNRGDSRPRVPVRRHGCHVFPDLIQLSPVVLTRCEMMSCFDFSSLHIAWSFSVSDYSGTKLTALEPCRLFFFVV